MAILCGLLMISFVVADPLMQYFNGGPNNGMGARAGEIVAMWNGGQINEKQLDDAIMHRNILSSFQQQVYVVGTRSAQEAGVGDLPLRVRPLQLPTNYSQGVERDVIQKKIFAQQARDAGMVVSDEMVIDYLAALGRDRVTNDQMRDIITRSNSGAGSTATIGFIFDLIREELLSRNYITSHSYAFETILPAERWEDWLQVNDQIILEAAPIRADDFLDKVGEPTDEEIAELYESFNSIAPVPDVLVDYGGLELPSPNPAFATPERVSVQFVKADFNAFADRLAENVSEEEISKYYEENRESFIKADEALFGDDSLFETDEKESNEEDAESEEEASDDDAEADGTDSSDTESSDTDSNNEESSNEAEESEANEETVNEETAEESASETVEEEEEEEESDDSEDDKKYQTLEEVSDQIRRQIAEGNAANAIRELMTQLKIELDDEYAGYFDAMLNAEDAGKEAPAPPAALADLNALALKHGLTYEKIEPTSLVDLRESGIGQTGNAEESSTQGFRFWVLCFRKGDLDLYEPASTFDVDGNRYLALVTERLERVEPELDEIRDEVIAAWKKQKAGELALAEAEKLAKEAEEKGMPLSALFAEEDNRGSFETNPFSFLMVGGVSQEGEVQLQLSQPNQVIAAGPDLLKNAFELGTEEVGAALNHDHSIAYLMRVASHLESDDALRARFIQEGETWYGLPAMMRARIGRAAKELYKTLGEESDVQWVREVDRVDQ